MGRVNNPPANLIDSIYKDIEALQRAIRVLSARPVTVTVKASSGSLILSDGDGQVWVDIADESLHYVVNGHERKVVGTLV